MVKNNSNTFEFTKDWAEILRMACHAARTYYENLYEQKHTDHIKDESIKYREMYHKLDDLIYGGPTYVTE